MLKHGSWHGGQVDLNKDWTSARIFKMAEPRDARRVVVVVVVVVVVIVDHDGFWKLTTPRIHPGNEKSPPSPPGVGFHLSTYAFHRTLIWGHAQHTGFYQIFLFFFSFADIRHCSSSKKKEVGGASIASFSSNSEEDGIDSVLLRFSYY